VVGFQVCWSQCLAISSFVDYTFGVISKKSLSF
jgi:hypothetical protein